MIGIERKKRVLTYFLFENWTLVWPNEIVSDHFLVFNPSSSTYHSPIKVVFVWFSVLFWPPVFLGFILLSFSSILLEEGSELLYAAYPQQS